jgi:RNA polymerase sigma-70 factor, ECF subfamily
MDLAQKFEENRGHLRAVAYRMLGSLPEAEDAVQEAWLRLSRSDASEIDNLGGWLTTVVSRVCLDMLRSKKSRREEALEPEATATKVPQARDAAADPEREVMLADSVGSAMLMVLNTLAPPERVAFVLHDMFGISFDVIAEVVGRTPEAARQLASRARRRVQGKPVMPEADLARQRAVVDAFLAASRSGNFAALLDLLDPDVAFDGDSTAAAARGEIVHRGAQAVAKYFAGRAQSAFPALVNGALAVVVPRNGALFVVLHFAVADTGRIVGIHANMNRDYLDRAEVAVLPDVSD